MKLTFSVRSVIRLDKMKQDGNCPIHFSVRVGAITTRLSSGKSINPKDWDDKNNCPKKKDKYLQLLATYLNKKESGFETFMLTRESLGKSITLNVAMDYFRDNTKVSLFKFWEQQIDLWQLTKEPNTLKSYKSGLNVIREFNPKLNFGDLSYDCIQKFDLFLRKVRSNSTGGCFTKHKILKAMINQAIMKGYMNENPYRYFKIKSAVGNRKFLSIDEVKQIMVLEIPANNGFLNRVKDLFLFSCFTGLRYSDVVNVRWENIKSEPERIEIQVKKTDKPLTIPLSSKAIEILDKYSKLTIKSPKSLALPKMANQVINRGIKELMELAGITKSISFHCARHTFASNHVEAGTYMPHLKDLLGHTNIVQTQIYAKTLPADLYDTMDKLNNMYKHVG
ncbi:site-specific integrase [Pedobacter cryophilus]|uniref:Site-specific integrase n=1 Tax=Pedobacter cryophilus TaxID=2571271 RepID=A0A4U1BUC4_9SPHI|nr:site-specific integrase [Pedobacter cryophilus]TKB95742.1 site-specific integrase [Pedobacter cryophilus]